MTTEQFGDFELSLEWKVSKNGNSGIIYRATTDGPSPWSTGPEFQVLDNAGHADGKSPLTSAGSNYAVNPPLKDVTKPVGEWNSIRLIAKGNRIEHWMNGVKLLEYEVGSPDWEARVKASKFATMPGYGRAKRGHLVLQDHGDCRQLPQHQDSPPVAAGFCCCLSRVSCQLSVTSSKGSQLRTSSTIPWK